MDGSGYCIQFFLEIFSADLVIHILERTGDSVLMVARSLSLVSTWGSSLRPRRSCRHRLFWNSG